MYRWINESGETVRTSTVREFCDLAGISHGNARNLACGHRTRHGPWCSTAPKARRQRERFLTGLVNTRTGERFILGRSVKHFANTHGLSFRGLSTLVNGSCVAWNGWVLEKT